MQEVGYFSVAAVGDDILDPARCDGWLDGCEQGL
jgi:hypothetical protein